MTPEEKWARLNNPKTPEDYGLCLSEEELGTFEDGRKILADVKQAACRGQDQFSEVAKSFGERVGKTVDNIVMGVLQCQKP